MCRANIAVVAHHVKTRGSGGGDGTIVPLCFEHHVGESGVHPLGVKTFRRKHGIDLPAYAVALRVYYEKMRGLR